MVSLEQWQTPVTSCGGVPSGIIPQPRLLVEIGNPAPVVHEIIGREKVDRFPGCHELARDAIAPRVFLNVDRPLRIVHLVSPRSANAEDIEAGEVSTLTINGKLAGNLQCTAPAIGTVAAVIFKEDAHLPGAPEFEREDIPRHFDDLNDQLSLSEGEGVDATLHVIDPDRAEEALADGCRDLQGRALGESPGDE